MIWYDQGINRYQVIVNEFTVIGEIMLGRKMHVMIFIVQMVKANEGFKEGNNMTLNRSYLKQCSKWILDGQD